MYPNSMFCPNVDCENNVAEGLEGTNWYIRFGFYFNKRLKKKIQRFRCKNCGKTFSVQTFMVDYWIKITIDYKELIELNTTIATISEMARMKGVSYSVIRNRIERLSRQFIALDSRNRRLLSGIGGRQHSL